MHIFSNKLNDDISVWLMTRNVFDLHHDSAWNTNWSTGVPLLYNFPKKSLRPCRMKMKDLRSSWDGLDICISRLRRISRGSSLCTGQCNEFCMGSGEGYSVGSQSLPRGSVYHQSPVSPPELFNRISNSYKCCPVLEWTASLQTSHLLRNDKLQRKVWKNSFQVDLKMLSKGRKTSKLQTCFHKF